MDMYPPAAQRLPLLAFAAALDSSSKALRRDGCGDWHISGKTGHVYAVPGGFQLIVSARSGRAWGFLKKALCFARLSQEGDDEGSFFLDRPPTAAEAGEIRGHLGISKKKHYSEEYREVLRRRIRMAA